MNKMLKLKNGMRVHLVPFSGTQATTVLVLTKVGSRYEPDNLWGASHFIEHLMFKGTERRPSTVEISQTLDRYGAYFNAYTGKDITGYYVKIDKDQTELAVDLLHDMVFNSLYDVEEMDRERKVIIEEIKMYEENPIMHIDDLLEEAQFEGNRLGKNIAGDANSMMTMKREDIIEFRDRNYGPENMVIAIAGAVPENIVDVLESTFGSVQSKGEPLGFESFGTLPVFGAPRVRVQSKELEQIQLAIGFNTFGRRHEDRQALEVLSNLLGGMMSSRLFIEVRERRGLCYSIRSTVSFHEEIGSFAINAGLDAGRVEEALQTIFVELKKLKTDLVSADELRYTKDNLAGGMKLRLENSSSVAEFYGRQELFYDEVKSPEEVLAQIEKVTVEDIRRVAREVFDEKYLSVAAVGPYKSSEELRKFIPNLA
jgi:predicted Zn-dependent peptidase